MTASQIAITIISPEQTLFSGRAHHIVAPGEMGGLEIYPGHAPLLTYLKPGPVHIVYTPGDETVFYVSEGFLEVQPKLVTLLVHTAIHADCLEEVTVLNTHAQISQKLKQQHSSKEYATLLAQLAQNLGQLNTLRRQKSRAQI